MRKIIIFLTSFYCWNGLIASDEISLSDLSKKVKECSYVAIAVGICQTEDFAIKVYGKEIEYEELKDIESYFLLIKNSLSEKTHSNRTVVAFVVNTFDKNGKKYSSLIESYEFKKLNNTLVSVDPDFKISFEDLFFIISSKATLKLESER
jgi:hypothetical protein